MSDSVSAPVGSSLGLLAISMTRRYTRRRNSVTEDLIIAWQRADGAWLLPPLHRFYSGVLVSRCASEEDLRWLRMEALIMHVHIQLCEGLDAWFVWQHTNTTQVFKQKQMATVKAANCCQQRLSWGQPVWFRGAGMWQPCVITLW